MKKGLIFATTLAMALGVGAAVGAHQGKVASVAEAYAQLDNTWYLCHEGNSWSKNSSADHFTYSKDVGNNWEYVTDNYIELAKDEKFNIVFSWNNGANWNTFTPNLQTDQSSETVFEVPANTDYAVAKRAIKVKFFFQVYGESASWTGLYWEEYVAPDVPTSDGYYIVGSESDWKFAGATKMDAGQSVYNARKLQYHAAASEQFKIRSYLNGVDTWYGVGNYGQDNYSVGDTAKDLNVFLSASNELIVEDYVTPPADEGYYVRGSASSWGYVAANKMDNVTGDNVAQKMSFTAAVDDEIKVSSYYTDRLPYTAWAIAGDTIDTSDENRPFDKVGDNIKFRKAGAYDIYAKYEDRDGDEDHTKEAFVYYVAEHVDSYTVEMTAVLFEGKAKMSTVALGDQYAYANNNFNPVVSTRDGYYTREVYEDENCTAEYLYSPKKFSANGHLYVKYTRLGYYVTGDATYAGSEALAWNVDGSTFLTEEVDNPNNMLEGTVTIPASASEQNKVSVKPLEYVGGNSPWAGVDYTMGATYTYAYMDEDNLDPDSRSNIVFTKGGTFAVYVNKSRQVYLNEGLDAFLTKFLTDTGHVCKTDNTTNLTNLKTVWTDLENAYKSLDPTTEQATIVAAENEGKEDGTDLQKVVARYHYITHKYGTVGEDGLTDFIWGETIPANSLAHNDVFSTNDSNNLAILVIAISATIAAGVLLIILKKKRHQ